MKITHIETYPVEIPAQARAADDQLAGPAHGLALPAGARADRRGHRGRRRGHGHAALERRDRVGRRSADRTRPGAGARRLRSGPTGRDRPADGRGLSATTGSPRARSKWPAGTSWARPPASRSTSCSAARSGRWRFAAATAWAPTSPSAPRPGPRSWSRRLHHDQGQGGHATPQADVEPRAHGARSDRAGHCA